jgi:hypothetical protein
MTRLNATGFEALEAKYKVKLTSKKPAKDAPPPEAGGSAEIP